MANPRTDNSSLTDPVRRDLSSLLFVGGASFLFLEDAVDQLGIDPQRSHLMTSTRAAPFVRACPLTFRSTSVIEAKPPAGRLSRVLYFRDLRRSVGDALARGVPDIVVVPDLRDVSNFIARTSAAKRVAVVDDGAASLVFAHGG